MNNPATDDRGALGPANLARPFVIETVATGSLRIGEERAEAKRYTDAHLVDRLFARAQINDRQHDAAQKVLEMWVAAGHSSSPTASYAPPGWRRGHDDDVEHETPRDVFRHLLGGCSSAHAGILWDMCEGRHPGVPHLATLQAALGDLAHKWGM